MTVDECISFQIERTQTLFDVLDDDRDEIQYSNEVLNRYFEEGHLRSTRMDDDEMIDDTSLAETRETEVAPSAHPSTH